MTDLHDLLEVASRSGRSDAVHDLDADLRLGRRVLRRRRISAATGATAAVLVVGALVGGAALQDWPAVLRPAGSTATEPSAGFATPSLAPSAPSDPSEAQMTERPAQSGPYRFGLTPVGWVGGKGRPFVGTLVPIDGSVSTDPTNLVGKITVMIDSRETKDSLSLVDGQGWTAERAIVVGGKAMTLVVQVPAAARVSPDDVDRFVDAITVGRDAEAAVS